MYRDNRELFTFYSNSLIFNFSSLKKLFSMCVCSMHIFIYKQEHVHLHVIFFFFFSLWRVGCRGNAPLPLNTTVYIHVPSNLILFPSTSLSLFYLL